MYNGEGSSYFRPALSLMPMQRSTAAIAQTVLTVDMTNGSMAPISFKNTVPYLEPKTCPVACKKKLLFAKSYK